MDVIATLRNEKENLTAYVQVLVKRKKKLYSNMDIESPVRAEEKALNSEIASIFSRINQIVSEIRKSK